MKDPTHIEIPDVILIGSGIMSACLGVMLKRLDPGLTIQVYEATRDLAQESSNGWNNAGTGHAGICEMNYTAKREADGTLDVTTAIEIFEQFEQSKQFWGYAVAQGMIANPREFINPLPHISFVHGQDLIEFLRSRHAKMSAHHFFREMVYSEDPATIASWAPLLLEGRDDIPIAATKMDGGTDINFGELARKLLTWLASQEGCGVAAGCRVVDLIKVESRWEVRFKVLAANENHSNHSKFVFVGAGGGSLPLLQKSDIAESRGLGGFPVGGQWLVCDNPEIIKKHRSKVYGKSSDAASPMSFPHLDVRILDGKRTLLFGPFAAWTTKFLRYVGHWSDLPLSIRPDNLAILIKTGVTNLGLIRYLIQQGTQSMEDRLKVLRIYYPAAKAEDWKLIDAGVRVQAIKKTDGAAGPIDYGTVCITSADRSISTLLGSSPGASVSVSVVLDVIKQCFPNLFENSSSMARMKEMIPTWNEDIKLSENVGRFEEVRALSNKRLQLS